MTDLKARVRIPEDILFRDLDGEAVLLNLESGKYYGLDRIGSRMWNLLAEHGRVELAYQALLNEYEVDAVTLQADLIELIERLAGDGLLVIEPSNTEARV